MTEPRTYLVTLWRYDECGRQHRRRVMLRAYDAEEAERCSGKQPRERSRIEPWEPLTRPSHDPRNMEGHDIYFLVSLEDRRSMFPTIFSETT